MVSTAKTIPAMIGDLRNGLFKLEAQFNPSCDSFRKSINSRAPLRDLGLEFFHGNTNYRSISFLSLFRACARNNRIKLRVYRIDRRNIEARNKDFIRAGIYPYKCVDKLKRDDKKIRDKKEIIFILYKSSI